MVFSSTVFVFAFLPITYILYLIIHSEKARNALLILTSLFFYAYGEPVAVLLMLCSIIINYVCGLFMNNSRLKKPVLIFSVIVNISLLVVFKYLGFLVQTFNSVTGLSVHVPQIALPIGISFFTFQAMSYVIDAYKKPELIEKNIFNICLYISFFPQLIAGPIVKFSDISAQIKKREITVDKTVYGIKRFIFGLSKKLIVSNTAAVIADSAFALDKNELTSSAAIIGAVSYCLQIYFDFSGYSDMAIGLGKMFGFDFKENFNYPFSASSMTDFWRRWNISVSSWFKEYVYIPLGGNRKGRIRTNINKCIVFLLTGLWHGANMTFVLWGVIHGLFLTLENFRIIPAKDVKNTFGKIITHIYSLMVIMLTFVIFRADTITQAFDYIGRIFTGGFSTNPAAAQVLGNVTPFAVIIMIIGAVCSTPVFKNMGEKLCAKGKVTLVENTSMICTLVLFALCILSLSTAEYNPFIYFRF